MLKINVKVCYWSSRKSFGILPFFLVCINQVHWSFKCYYYVNIFVRYCCYILLSLVSVAFTKKGRVRLTYKVVGCL